MPGLLVAVFVGLLFLLKWINILNEYERAVTFWLGRLAGAEGARAHAHLLAVRAMVRMSLRTVVLDVPPQDIITRTTSR